LVGLSLLAATPLAAQQPSSRVDPKAPAADPGRYPFFPLAAVWTGDAKVGPSAAPASDARRLYVAWSNGIISTYDLATGGPVTAITFPTSLPLILAGPVLLVTGDAVIDGLRADDLGARWRTPLPAKAAFAPTARAGWAFVALADGSLVALRTDSGEIVWRTEPTAAPSVPPVVEGDRVYAASAGGIFQARGVADGKEIWRATLEGDITAVAAVEGRVFAATAGRWLYALDAKRGQVRWRYRLGGSAIGMVTDDDRVVLVMLDQSIRAFKMGSGAQAWRQTLPFRPVAGPVLAGGGVLVTGYAPILRVYDRHTGAVQGWLAAWLPPPASTATETLAAGPAFQPRATVFDDLVILVTQRGWYGSARRLFDLPAAPLTVMPTAALPAPAPPPGWVPPPPAPAGSTAPATASAPAATGDAPVAPPPAATPPARPPR